MPVYHFTLHAYRSWSPNHPRGYTRLNEGYQSPDPDRAREYDERARFEPVVFDRKIQEIVILGTIDICRRRGWRLHGIGTDANHVHMVVSWKHFLEWEKVQGKIKNLLSLFLGRASGQEGREWFVRYGSRKRVQNHKHLEYLLKVYLPDHRGPFWREGDPVPPDVHGVL